MFCGWDWGSRHHGVCVIDEAGTIVKQWLVQHTRAELDKLFAELAELAHPNDLPIAIERSEGLVVGLITAAGHPVLMAEPAGFERGTTTLGVRGHQVRCRGRVHARRLCPHRWPPPPPRQRRR